MTGVVKSYQGKVSEVIFCLIHQHALILVVIKFFIMMV